MSAGKRQGTLSFFFFCGKEVEFHFFYLKKSNRVYAIRRVKLRIFLRWELSLAIAVIGKHGELYLNLPISPNSIPLRKTIATTTSLAIYVCVTLLVLYYL